MDRVRDKCMKPSEKDQNCNKEHKYFFTSCKAKITVVETDEETVNEKLYKGDLQLSCDEYTTNLGFLYQCKDTLKCSDQGQEEDANNPQINTEQITQLCRIAHTKWIQGGDPRRMSPKNIILVKRLGTGPFSIMFEAILQPPNERPQKVLLKKRKTGVSGAWLGSDIYRERDVHIYLQPHRRVQEILGCFYDKVNTECNFILQIARGSLESLNKNLKNVDKGRFMRHFIEGIEWMHGKDIIHNNLQPTNLLVTFQNNLVLSEFGSARLLPKEAEAIRTKNDLGTPGFKDDQATWCNEYSKASDIFTAACSLFELEFGGEHLLKYKYHPDKIPVFEYIMALRFGKLCLADVQLKYDNPKFPQKVICGKSGGQFDTRTPLRNLVRKSEMSSVLESMIKSNRHSRPSASDVLNHRDFRTFITRLGCSDDNLNCHLEPNAHNSGNFMRVADMKIDDSGNPSLQANTNRERHSVELQVINEAMSATYYDVTVGNNTKLALRLRSTLAENFMVEIIEPADAAFRKIEDTECIQIMPKTVWPVPLGIVDSRFSIMQRDKTGDTYPHKNYHSKLVHGANTNRSKSGLKPVQFSSTELRECQSHNTQSLYSAKRRRNWDSDEGNPRQRKRFTLGTGNVQQMSGKNLVSVDFPNTGSSNDSVYENISMYECKHGCGLKFDLDETGKCKCIKHQMKCPMNPASKADAVV